VNIGGGAMALFGNKENAEDKRAQEEKEFLEKYGLENLNPEDMKILKRITSDLAGNKWFKAGMALSFARAEEQAKVTYLSSLVEQNWLLIRKLDDISKKLGQVINKQ
jgi:hypothetical protein